MISLKEEYFKRILEGTKLFEFRKVFAVSLNEPFLCVIYVSSPIKAIQGVVYFDRPIKDSIDNLLELARKTNYLFIEGIRDYFNNKKIGYALPVISARQFKQPIKLKEIQKIYDRFKAPQSFYCLENKQFLKIKEYIDNYESHNEID